MSSRMDKYKNEELIPTRSDKNKELYKQIYNAYDEFENLVVPSNSREITMSDLKKEITSRGEYRDKHEYSDIIKKDNEVKDIKQEKVYRVKKEENEVYDINELIKNAVTSKKGPSLIEPTLSNGDYLKKLKLDNSKTNIEQVKEMYEDIQEESQEEDESLLKTANLSLEILVSTGNLAPFDNLSLEILSDLKSDNDATMVGAPIKEEELPDNHEEDFYSNSYVFSKKDFEGKEEDNIEKDDIYDDDDEEEKTGNGKLFLRILLIVFGILAFVILLFYFINFFNKV